MYRMYTTLTRIALTIAIIASTAQAWASPAEDQYTIAAGHYSQQRWQYAASEFRQFLSTYPDHHWRDKANFFLGETLIQLGEYADANQCFQSFVTAQPKGEWSARARFRSAEAAYLGGDQKIATRDLQAFRKNHPNHQLNAYVLAYQGELALAAGNVKEGTEMLSRGLELYPQGPLHQQTRFNLARGKAMQGDYQAAQKLYREVASASNPALANDARLQIGLLKYNQQEYEQAAHEFGELLSKAPNGPHSVHARQWQGIAYFASRRWQEASKVLIDAITQHPDHSASDQLHFFAGEALREQQSHQQALKYYDALLANWPESSYVARALQGKIHITTSGKHLEQAAELAEQLYVEHPDAPNRLDGHRLVSVALVRQQQYSQAVKSLEQFSKRIESLPVANPLRGNQWLPYHLGLAYLGTKQHDKALKVLDEIDLQGVDKELEASIYSARATALMGASRYADAIPAMQNYLEIQSDGPDAGKTRGELAVAFAHTGDFPKAKEALADYAAKHPGHKSWLPTVHCIVELAYAGDDRTWAAELFQELAREGNPQSYVVKGLSGIAWSQWDQNDPTKSAQTFARLIEQYPDSDLAADASIARARTLQHLQRYEAALSAYELVLERYPDSKQLPLALHGAAGLYDRLQQDEQADDLYQRFIAEFPDHEKIADALYQRAWVLIDLKQTDKAYSLFQQVHDQHPQAIAWTDATYRLAEQAAEKQDYAKAERLTSSITNQGTKDAALEHTYYLQGQLAIRQQQWAKVATPLQRLLKEFPQTALRAPSQYWIAESYYRTQNYPQARLQFDALARNTRGRNKPWMAMVPLRQGHLFALNKRWPEAQEAAESIAKDFPGFSQQYEADFLIGRALVGQGRIDDARKVFLKVVQSEIGAKTETAARAQWMIGEGYFLQKKYDDAIGAYARVEQLYDYPSWQAAALLQAGKCHEMKGEWDLATGRYAQLVKQFTQSELNKEASRRMRVAQQRSSIPR